MIFRIRFGLFFHSQKSAFSNQLQKIKATKMFLSRNPMFL